MKNQFGSNPSTKRFKEDNHLSEYDIDEYDIKVTPKIIADITGAKVIL
jgi:hypothetical protein